MASVDGCFGEEKNRVSRLLEEAPCVQRSCPLCRRIAPTARGLTAARPRLVRGWPGGRTTTEPLTLVPVLTP